jgi:hypothetical protein
MNRAILQCVALDALSGQIAVWTFSYISLIKRVILQCVSWDALLGLNSEWTSYTLYNKWPFSSVYPGMIVQIRVTSKSPLAHIAWKAPFTISHSFNCTSPVSGRCYTRFTMRHRLSVSCTCMTQYITGTREYFLTYFAAIKYLCLV